MNKIFTQISKQSGFSLIELIVGMAVGLIVMLVVTQTFGVFQNQQRVTSGTADAQTNGSIALYSMTRELQMAGYGVMPSNDANSPLECGSITLGTEAISNANMTAAEGINNLSPVTITEGAASDTITIRYGNSLLGGIPTTLTAAASGKVLTVGSNLNCRAGDFAIITRGTTCEVTRLADPQNTPTANSTQEIVIDAAEASPTLVSAGASNISCLGDWVERTYSVNNGILQQNGVDMMAGVMSIKAQYGVSATTNNNAITSWVDPAGTWAPGALTVATRNQIKAVRIAVIARNPKQENAAVTTACDPLATPPTGLCSWVGGPSIDLSSADSNWANYRYRVFETIIPLRNVIWSKDTL